MLVLFETSAGYAVFKLKNEKKLDEVENLYKEFEAPESATKLLQLKHFEKFEDTTDALAAATAAVEGKMSKKLKKMLKKLVVKEAHETLAVADAALGKAIKDKLDLSCMSNSAVQELMRCMRGQMEALISALPSRDMSAMALGLAHSLSRYKLKFSPDKVDTMIVQAISLLDDLDKELNNYIMRTREWYGWHFPELGKIVSDNLAYAKTVKLIGNRLNTATTDLSSVLPEDLEKEVKDAAEISMGTEVSEEDIINVCYMCEQVIEISDYRAQLYDYLKNRMFAIAPNLTILVGELVGARLIAHAGSLLNLAKHPSSTVQILGAEKALFRALKTKHDTPKYGLIYHASLVGQSNPKHKGKISRMLAAKAALAIRYDALGEDSNNDLGAEHRAKLERRLKVLEEGRSRASSGSGKAQTYWDTYYNKSEVKTYNSGADSTLPSSRKRKSEEDEDDKDAVKKEIDENETSAPPKKKKKVKEEKTSEEDQNSSSVFESDAAVTPKSEKKKKKKALIEEIKTEDNDEEQLETPSKEKKKKKKKESSNVTSSDAVEEMETVAEEPSSEKKKKKKKK